MTVRFALNALAGLLLSFWPLLGVGVEGMILWYGEREAGIEPYRVRYIVTRGFMRSDDGSEEGGFVLFDRAERQIYNSVPQNLTILRIDGRGELPRVPQDLSLEVRRSADEQAPKVGGRTPLKFELLANQELCYSAVIAPGHLPEAQRAFREFAQALAVQQSRTLASTPQEYQTPCFLARYLHATDFHLQEGLPLLEWSPEGRSRELLEYETGVDLDESLFELPDGFAVIEAHGQ